MLDSTPGSPYSVLSVSVLLFDGRSSRWGPIDGLQICIAFHACSGVLYNYIYPKIFFSISSRLVSQLRTVIFFSSPNPPSNHEHQPSESHQGEN